MTLISIWMVETCGKEKESLALIIIKIVECHMVIKWCLSSNRFAANHHCQENQGFLREDEQVAECGSCCLTSVLRSSLSVTPSSKQLRRSIARVCLQ
jgi:hypothetical protein